MSVIIAPSILAADFGNLQRDCEMVNNSKADWFHLDIMDGVFVPNISYGMPIINKINEVATKTLDVHLMIVNPDRYIETFKNVGADILTVHYEACTHLHRTIQGIKSNGMKAGVALNPHTSAHLLEDVLNDLDLILVMSVNPGFGGQSFIENTYEKVKTNKILINDLTRNQFQPRKNFSKEGLEELANSIREQGVIQPIIVRPSKSSEGKYEIIAGERRWLASQNAGLHEIPVVVLNVNDVKSLEFSLIENVQRQDLDPIEEARGYQRLIDDFNYNHDKLSKFIGKSRSYIANSLRLLSLQEEILLMVEQGNLSEGHARTLIGLQNSVELAKKIIQKKLSVRQAEILTRQFKNKKFKLIRKKDPNILDLQRVLEEKTGLSVSVTNRKNNSGTISFAYQDLNQLDRITNIIKNNY